MWSSIASPLRVKRVTVDVCHTSFRIIWASIYQLLQCLNYVTEPGCWPTGPCSTGRRELGRRLAVGLDKQLRFNSPQPTENSNTGPLTVWLKQRRYKSLNQLISQLMSHIFLVELWMRCQSVATNFYWLINSFEKFYSIIIIIIIFSTHEWFIWKERWIRNNCIWNSF